VVSEAKQISADAGGGLDRLYRRYAVWLHRRLRSSVGPEAAADVVQDTYIRIAPYADRGIRHPKAFLLKVAMNLVRDNHRTEARKDRRIAELAPPDAEAPPQFTQVLLGQVVRDMPQLYRDVFVLSRFGGMTYPDIARTLDVSVKTVEWRMARAMEYCASRLDL
jgi:RNA polymerase sigma factor (sigma-70 family)